MPKKLENKLRAEYGDNDKAVFGTMAKIEKAKDKKIAKTGKLGKRGKL